MKQFGQQLPHLPTEVPGAQSQQWVDGTARAQRTGTPHGRQKRRVHGVESPIVFAQAKGANIEDADGNIFVALSGAFAVAVVGHAHPKVVEAAKKQGATLIHAMGDLFPSREKVLLSERLADIAPEGLSRSILAIGGFHSVEACLITYI